MSNTLKLSTGMIIPADHIKRLRPLTDDDRTKMGDKLDIDASTFKTRIEMKDGSSKMARETVEELGKLLPLVNVGHDRFVPALNITAAEPFKAEDKAKAEGKGIKLTNTFRSRVETVAGVVLSAATAEQVMQRREKALGIEAPAKTVAAKGPKAPVNG